MTFRHQDCVTPGALYTDVPLCLSFRRFSLSQWPCLDLSIFKMRAGMKVFFRGWWWQDAGQDVAEYAVMLAVILTIAIGTIRLIGSHAGNVFASVGSAIQ